MAVKVFTIVVLLAVISLPAAYAGEADQSPSAALTVTRNRIQLFHDYKEWCVGKIVSDPKLTTNVLRVSNWSIDHTCECAAAVTVSNMNPAQVESAHQPYNVPTWNTALSNNIVSCLRIQP